MEWVETTGQTVEEAKGAALDQLGVGEEDAEFEVLEEPRSGLFGRVRGAARVRARVRPAHPRPKLERRRPSGEKRTAAPRDEKRPAAAREDKPRRAPARAAGAAAHDPDAAPQGEDGDGRPALPEPGAEAVGEQARQFLLGLAGALGSSADVSVQVEGDDIEVALTGDDLGLLIGPRGATLLAVQDLTRVASQRRLGDHSTHLRVDVAGYRERRREALSRFAADVAQQVVESGVARALEPMPSADRKIVHDALSANESVQTRSEGDDPNRRIVISPAASAEA
jgi:spoIIIJ-associated protein